ncbi:hypothetical protein [Nostoc sp. CHAB 5715]|nr:hypothetical protein [Nostoc sp. CHAB 5715]MCC5620652.1 hypothetical protein [Nostoc sp. CHAB 5715]
MGSGEMREMREMGEMREQGRKNYCFLPMPNAQCPIPNSQLDIYWLFIIG